MHFDDHISTLLLIILKFCSIKLKKNGRFLNFNLYFLLGCWYWSIYSWSRLATCSKFCIKTNQFLECFLKICRKYDLIQKKIIISKIMLTIYIDFFWHDLRSMTLKNYLRKISFSKKNIVWVDKTCFAIQVWFFFFFFRVISSL